MTDISTDPTLLSVETTVDTGIAEKDFSSFLEKMSSQSNDTARLLKELGGQLESLVDTVISKGRQAEDTAKRAQESVGAQQKTIQDKMKELRHETEESLEHIEKLYSEYGIKATGSLEQSAAAYEKAIKQIKEEAANPHGKLKGEEAKALLNEFEEDLKTIRNRIKEQKEKGVVEILSEKGSGALKSEAGMEGMLESLMEKALSPMGIFAGAFAAAVGMLEGSRVKAADTLLWFRKEVGEGAGEIAAGVGSSVESMGAHMTALAQKLKVSDAELGNTYSQMAKLGLSAEQAGFTVDAMSKATSGMSITASGLHENLGALAISVDKAFGLTTGTALEAAAKSSREMGTSVQHALEQMTHLRIEAEASGIGIDRYMGSVMQASKSLGQFGIDLGAATGLMAAFTDTDKEMGGNGARAARAMQGVGQLFGNLQNNVGMSAYLGEKVFGGDPIEARHKMLMNFGSEEKSASAEGRKVLAGIIQEVQKVGKSAGPNEGAQDFTIGKVFGISDETAIDMLRKITPKQIEDLKSGGTGGLSKEDQARIAKGFESSKERENSFEDFIKTMMSAIKDILMGTLTGIVGLGQLIGGSPLKGMRTLGAAETLLSSAAKEVMKSGGEMGAHLGEALGIVQDLTPEQKKAADEMAKQSEANAGGRFAHHGFAHSQSKAPAESGNGESGTESSRHTEMHHDPATGGFVGTHTIQIKMSPHAITNHLRSRGVSRGQNG